MKRETVHWCIQRPITVAAAHAYRIPIAPSFVWVEGRGPDGRRVILGTEILPQGFRLRDVPGAA